MKVKEQENTKKQKFTQCVTQWKFHTLVFRWYSIFIYLSPTLTSAEVEGSRIMGQFPILLFFLSLRLNDTFGDPRLLIPIVKQKRNNVQNEAGGKRAGGINDEEGRRRYLRTRGPTVRLRDYSDNQYVGTIGTLFSSTYGII